MKHKKWLLSIGGLVLSILFWIVFSRLIHYKVSNDALLSFGIELTYGSQVKQVILGIIMYLYGYFMVHQLLAGKSKYITALALPCGMMCWSISSMLIAIVGMPYTLLSTSCVMLLWLGCTFVICRVPIEWNRIFMELCIVSSIAVIAASGIFMIMYTSDSAYYIMKYGEILAIDGGITEDVSYWLTWTGISTAFWGSLVKFCGVYTIGTLHHMLMVSFLVGGTIYIYDLLGKRENGRTCFIMTAAVIGMLIITPGFFLLGHWQMQNTYYMIYMSIFIIMAYQSVIEKDEMPKRLWVLMSLMVIMLAMMRIESIVLLCFLIIGISTLEIGKKQLVGYLLVPSGCVLLGYWIRIYMTLGTIFTGMMSKQTLFVMVLAWILSVLYIIFIRGWMEKNIGAKIPSLILIGCVVLNIALAIWKSEEFKANIEVALANIANASWGYFPWLVLLAVVIIAHANLRMNFFDFIWIGYFLFNFALGMGKSGTFRLGEGDSVNRIFLSVIPIFYVAMTIHYVESKKQKEVEAS